MFLLEHAALSANTHTCAKFDRYRVGLVSHAAHFEASFEDLAGNRWTWWRLVFIFRQKMLRWAFGWGPFSSHSATRDRLSFHSAILLQRPCLRQDNSPRWTTLFYNWVLFKLWHLPECSSQQQTKCNVGSVTVCVCVQNLLLIPEIRDNGGLLQITLANVNALNWLANQVRLG